MVHDTPSSSAMQGCQGNVENEEVMNTDQGEGEKMLLKFSFVDPNISFSVINWCEVYNQLMVQSSSFSFITFADKYCTAILSDDKLSAEKLKSIEFIIHNEENIGVQVKLFKEGVMKGIIYSPITKPISNELLHNKLSDQGVEEVIKMEKIDNRTGQKYYTGSVILLFSESASGINEIKLDGVRLQFNQFIPRPMVCSHCGLVGHTTSNCNKKSVPFCKECLHLHPIQDVCIIKCKNCGGSHISNDNECQIIVKEVKILKLRDSHSLSYNDAKMLFSSINEDVFNKVDILFKQNDDMNDGKVKQLYKQIDDLTEKLDRTIIERDRAIIKIDKYERNVIPELHEKLQNKDSEWIKKVNEKIEESNQRFERAMEKQTKIVNERIEALSQKALTDENQIYTLKNENIIIKAQISDLLIQNSILKKQLEENEPIREKERKIAFRQSPVQAMEIEKKIPQKNLLATSEITPVKSSKFKLKIPHNLQK